jgi:RNA recognition motif-containing protein
MGKKLYITNLAPSIDASELEDIFTTVGNVESAQVAIDDVTGKGLGVGYIVMSTEQEAADCIARFHGQRQDGQVIAVVEDIPASLRLSRFNDLKAQQSVRKKKKR